MQRNLFIPIFFAVLGAVAGWLMLELMQHSHHKRGKPGVGDAALSQAAQRVDKELSQPRPAKRDAQPSPQSRIPGTYPLEYASETQVQRASLTIPAGMALVYKCERRGRAVYSDEPCGHGETAGAETRSARQDSAHSRPIPQAQPPVTNVTYQGSVRDAACRMIERDLGRVDSALSQPLEPANVEQLYALRNQIRDKFASFGCGG